MSTAAIHPSVRLHGGHFDALPESADGTKNNPGAANHDAAPAKDCTIDHVIKCAALAADLSALGECGLLPALEAMGERWSFLILRAAFNGIHHFEEFQATLHIARNILANRLGRLVDHGILSREAMAHDRRKVEYRLTEKGVELLPAMLALRQWGEKWSGGVVSSPILVDDRDQRPVRPIEILAHDGRVLTLNDLSWAYADEILPDQGSDRKPRLRSVG